MQKTLMTAIGLALGLMVAAPAMADSNFDRRGGQNAKVVRAAQAVKADANQLAWSLKRDYAPSALVRAAEKVAWEAKEVIEAARYSYRGHNGRIQSAVRTLKGRFGTLKRTFYRYGNVCSYESERAFDELEWSIKHLDRVSYRSGYDYDYPDYPHRPGRPGRGGIGGRTVIYN